MKVLDVMEAQDELVAPASDFHSHTSTIKEEVDEGTHDEESTAYGSAESLRHSVLSVKQEVQKTDTNGELSVEVGLSPRKYSLFREIPAVAASQLPYIPLRHESILTSRDVHQLFSDPAASLYLPMFMNARGSSFRCSTAGAKHTEYQSSVPVFTPIHCSASVRTQEPHAAVPEIVLREETPSCLCTAEHRSSEENDPLHVDSTECRTVSKGSHSDLTTGDTSCLHVSSGSPGDVNPNARVDSADFSFNISAPNEKESSDNHNENGLVKLAFSCEICSKTFISRGKLKRHILIHDNIRPFKCEVCDKTFTQKSNVKTHMLIHQNIRSFQCTICDRAFTLKGHLNTHMLTHSKVRSFQCEICNRSFVQKSNLNAHMVIHSDVRSFLCEVCNKSFTRKSDLNKHKVIHEDTHAFQCELCSRTFAWKGHLKKHMLIHQNIRPFSCGVCNKAFTLKEHLNAHMFIHQNICPFKCEVCGKTFKQKGNLKTHTLTHNSNHPFVCVVCQKSFPVNAYLQRHLKTHGTLFSPEGLANLNDFV